MSGNIKVSSSVVRRRRKTSRIDTAKKKASGTKGRIFYCENAFCKQVLQNSVARFCPNDFCQMRRGLLLASTQNRSAMSFLKKSTTKEGEKKNTASTGSSISSDIPQSLTGDGTGVRKASSTVMKPSVRSKKEMLSMRNFQSKNSKSQRTIKSHMEGTSALSTPKARTSTTLDTTTRFSEKKIRKKKTIEAREPGNFLIPLGKKQGDTKTVGGGRYIQNGNRLTISSSNFNTAEERRRRKSMSALRNTLSSLRQPASAVENISTVKELLHSSSSTSIEPKAKSPTITTKMKFNENGLKPEMGPLSNINSADEKTVHEQQKAAETSLNNDVDAMPAIHKKGTLGAATPTNLSEKSCNAPTKVLPTRSEPSLTKSVRTISAGEYLHGRYRLDGLVYSNKSELISLKQEDLQMKEIRQEDEANKIPPEQHGRETNVAPRCASYALELTRPDDLDDMANEDLSMSPSMKSVVHREITRQDSSTLGDQMSKENASSSNCVGAQSKSKNGSIRASDSSFDTQAFIPDVLKLPSFIYSRRHHFIYSLLVVFADVLSSRFAAVKHVTKKPRKLKFYLEYIRRAEHLCRQFHLKVILERNQALVTIRDRKWMCIEGGNTVTLYKQVLERLLSQSEMWQSVINETSLVMRNIRRNEPYSIYLAVAFQQLWKRLPTLASIAGDRHVWYYHGLLHHWVFTIDNVEIGSGSHVDQHEAYSEACADSMSFLLDILASRTQNVVSRDSMHNNYNPKISCVKREMKRQRTHDWMDRSSNSFIDTYMNAPNARSNESQAGCNAEVPTMRESEKDQDIACISCEMLRLRKPDHPQLKCHRCQSSDSSHSQPSLQLAFPQHASNVPSIPKHG